MRSCLFGAAPDTGNMGVSALCFATLGQLLRQDPSHHVTVFDYGRGTRENTVLVDGRAVRYMRSGGYDTRRLYRRESLWNIQWSARMGGIGNSGAKALLAADTILDISGGDSFTDLYGAKRFWEVARPKLMALDMRRPLILLPQTYGPFEDTGYRAVAARIVRQAAMAWARDERSFDVLRDLAGNDFDPSRHRCGVDVAFGLEARRPGTLPGELQEWVNVRDKPIVGINVSGLIYLDTLRASRRYRLRANYREVIDRLLRKFLRETDARIALVPHVLTPEGHYESDSEACRAATAVIPDAVGRVTVVPCRYDQSEIKWIIGQTDWFCGTRMHSTIAGLSGGVPTAAIAYSDKTRGVFETCGQGNHVVDPRSVDTEEVVERVWQSWSGRAEARESLARSLPAVLGRARAQIAEVLSAAAAGSAYCKELAR